MLEARLAFVFPVRGFTRCLSPSWVACSERLRT